MTTNNNNTLTLTGNTTTTIPSPTLTIPSPAFSMEVPVNVQFRYQTACDPASGLCTAKLKVPRGRAYDVPVERQSPEFALRVASSPHKSYLGYAWNIETKQVDESDRTILFVASSEAVDRYGDIIEQAGWMLDNYRKNPVGLYAHDSRGFTASHGLPIFRGQRVFIEDRKLFLLAKFAEKEVFEFADVVFRLAAKGFLHAVSVGFIPMEFEYIKPIGEDGESMSGYGFGRRFTKQELLEVSVVSIPANPEALVVGRGFEAVLQSVELEESAPPQEVPLEICNGLAQKVGGHFTIDDGTACEWGTTNPSKSSYVGPDMWAVAMRLSDRSDMPAHVTAASEPHHAREAALAALAKEPSAELAIIAQQVGEDHAGNAVFQSVYALERSVLKAKATQTAIFRKSAWTVARAKAWLAKHGLRSDKLDETGQSYRFRQFNPSECAEGSFETLTENLPAGVSLVVCDRKKSTEVPVVEVPKKGCACGNENEPSADPKIEEILATLGTSTKGQAGTTDILIALGIPKRTTREAAAASNDSSGAVPLKTTAKADDLSAPEATPDPLVALLRALETPRSSIEMT